MFQKVKKFGSKLFGEDRKDSMDADPGSLGKTSPPMHPNGGMHAEQSSPSKSFLPPVSPSNSSFSAQQQLAQQQQIQLQQQQVMQQQQQMQMQQQQYMQQMAPQAPRSAAPAAVAGIMAPTAPGGRRKSTPAALDMALRTAEGKAAIEELINSGGKKQMVFGQYFGNSKTPDVPKAGSAARINKAALGQFGSSGKGMGTVMEDDDPEEMHIAAAPAAPAGYQQQQQQAPAPYQVGAVNTAGSGHLQPGALQNPAFGSVTASVTASNSPRPAVKRPMDAISSPNAVGGREAQKPAVGQAAMPPQQQQQQPHGLPPQHPQAPPMHPVAHVPAPAPAPVEEEPPPHKRTKLLALANQLPNNMTRKYWSLSDYSIMRKMYTGYASTVYQATCKKSLEQVALKVYHMENLCELNHYQVYREIRVHAGLQHQNIIGLYCAFQEGNDVVMVQEYAEGGDLYRLLHRNGGRLGERQAVEMVLHPFLLSLHYLHTRGIMHRDIKPENVLFTDQRVLKLADFGLAIDLNDERAVTRAGTLDYMAPEVLRCPPKNLPHENKNNTSLHYNNSVDAWAVGVFAYELIVGFPPFAGESQLASVDKIIHSTPEFPEKISELAKAFIIAALKKHPGDRPSVMEMLHHPWIRTYQRRASVRIPQAAMRRRSSVQYQAGVGGVNTLVRHEEGPMPHMPNIDNMTPEDIENAIRGLQMAKPSQQPMDIDAM